MKYLFKGIYVDSGSFVVADPEVLVGDYSGLKGLGYATFRVPKGTYKCSWKLLNSPEDKPVGRGTLKVVSGVVYVVDPSYVTRSCASLPKGVVEVDRTGGDGTFDIEFSLIKK